MPTEAILIVLALLLLAALAFASIRVVREYERAVAFRLGRLRGPLGPGIVLTINDNPKDANGTIVDQDLRQVANGLWLAGAEAISINGHRLSARTAIRQAGAAITVDYRSLTTPYRIEAIGDPGALESGFTGNSGGAWLSYLRRNYGVSWAIERRKEVRLGPDAGLAVGHAGVA